MLGEVTDHGVSGGPAIFLQCQASKSVSSCQAFCLASLWSALSVGGSSSEDDSLNSLGGCPPWGLLGAAFARWAGPSPRGQTLGRCPCVY